jgi:hypothetical protein
VPEIERTSSKHEAGMVTAELWCLAHSDKLFCWERTYWNE